MLVHFYIFLELFLFAYVQELKIRHYNQYFDEVAEWYCMEEETLPSDNSMNDTAAVLIPTENPTVVKLSELDDAAEGLFAELKGELNFESSMADSIGWKDSFVDEIVYEHDFEINEPIQGQDLVGEDCIQITDLEETTLLPLTGYESFASAKIADEMEGPQQWVVSIVGMEESYIHISDGKRLWLKVGEKAAKLKNGDVLILDVIRNGKEVVVENLFRLETDASDEYIIPDEEYQFLQAEESIAI